MKTKISVIVPVYNVRDYIVECLDSIRKQTYKDYEVILVNDGTVDDSAEIVENYISEYGLKNFHLYAKQNGGLSSARNHGMQYARGEWVLFLDSDDWIEPECLALLMQTADKYPTADLVIGGYAAYDNQTGEKEVWSNYPTEYAEMPEGLQQLHSFGFCWGRLYRKSIIDEHNLTFDTRIKYAEDNAWQFDYHRFGRAYAYQHAVLYNYRINRSGSLTEQLIGPRKKYYIWEHVERFLQQIDEDILYKSIETNIALNRVLWGVWTTAINNDILDKNYKKAKTKVKSKLSKHLARCYRSRSRKDDLYKLLWKLPFVFFRLFVQLYYNNFEKLRNLKVLRRLLR